jgi:quinate/shikimate dehydrogenase (NAD+)
VSERVLLGLVGAGIGASLSPALHEREAGRLGLRCLYRTIDLADLGLGPSAVGDVLAAARLTGFAGLNVTHPCKQTVLEHLDAVAPDAAALGAVNTVVLAGGPAVGHNTDASGFAEGFARGLPDAEMRRVVLLGAGGAGAAVGHAALALGADRLTIVDVDGARAAALARSLGRQFDGERVGSGEPDALPDLLADADGLIHATPTGMAGRPGMPLPADLLHPGLWVADIVYRPLDTELLGRARAAGCRTLDGGRMVVFQAAASFALFTGIEPDRDRMLRHFGQLVERPAAAGAPAR